MTTAHKEPRLVVAPKSVARFKAKLKMVLRRARGDSSANSAKDLAPVLRSWTGYTKQQIR